MGIISLVIAFWGIVVGIFLFVYGNSFKEKYKSFDRIAINNTPDYSEKIDTAGNITISRPIEMIYDRQKLEDLRDKYEKDYAWYVVFSQSISLFPLMGIFGTVSGLVFSDITAVDSLVKGLNVALLTTFIGLICSIVLKAIDAVYPGRYINLIDSEFNKADSVILRQTLKEEVIQAKKNSTRIEE